jgi:hypothetical protein
MPNGIARVVSAGGTDGIRRHSLCVASRHTFEAVPTSFPTAIPRASMNDLWSRA